MQPQPYDTLTPTILLALCVWREARGEGQLGKRGVAHVVMNRASAGGFGEGVVGVILRPYQFSSFNSNDPNSTKWPDDLDPYWVDSVGEASKAITGQSEDPTSNAVFYFSPPLTEPPHAWGPVEVTVVIGRLTFCRPVAVVTDLGLAGES